MISALTGELRRIDTDRVCLQAGPILYELLVPAADIADLQASMGEELTLHTIMYIEGDASRGNLEPRLIGFLRVQDRQFFQRFTTVKGIGPKTALKAFSEPVGLIAAAIESHDTKFLTRLKGIGKRTAELIVAELAGKVQDFALTTARPAARVATHDPVEEDAIEGLVSLGEPRPLAERLLERVKQANPSLKSSGALLREMLQMRG